MSQTFVARVGSMVVVLLVVAVGCESARLPVTAGMGPRPELPPPRTSLIPTVNVAPARGWPDGGAPTAAPGLSVRAYAAGLDHPRWLCVLPNGDVLVAETNAPPKPDDNKGIKGWFFKRFQKKAGGAVPSANRITLLRDADGDGVAETRTAFITGLNAPFGMALVGNDLYVANSDALVRFPYVAGATSITASPTPVVALPAGRINHHWTKSLVASRDGRRLYVGVGSNSNVAENDMAAEAERAAIWEIDPSTGAHRVFASGLRNGIARAGRRRRRRARCALRGGDVRGTARLLEPQAGERLPRALRAVRERCAAGPAVDVLTGFLSERGEAFGRPVGVAIDKRGALLVADDVGNTVWRVTAGGVR